MLRYDRHYFTAAGVHAEPVAAAFLDRANEEPQRADRIAERIVQLRGEPSFSPGSISLRSHTEYVEDDSRKEMIKEDLVADRIAIESYREIVA